ncbi:hypothetical protein [Actinacidiphila guanduensis]|jgi:hypothetical protein|uniref:Uncharacterized protein n=1 Tax=Actinacidiphila guanduensis TaxID=310781 RepID=A0A1G9W067_9ACTN|nr:hypothetical protein [Actinacidiphila guanduensis]SDM77912.1 hypothetical protein SAMN05216259_101468 [Actinacidiphila guanduensis]
MAHDAIEEMTGRLSPENRRWVEQLPNEKKRELVQKWQNEGGATGLGNVGTDVNEADADAVVEKFRKS